MQKFNSKVNVTLERYKLYKLHQTRGQKFEDYLVDVIEQVDNCRFMSMHEELILYKIVGGIQNDEIRNVLLAEADLKLDEAIEIVRAMDFTSGAEDPLKTEEAGDYDDSREVIRSKKNKKRRSGTFGWKTAKMKVTGGQESEGYSKAGGSSENESTEQFLSEYIYVKPSGSGNFEKRHVTKTEEEDVTRDEDVSNEVEIDWRGIDDHYVIEIYSNEPRETIGDVGMAHLPGERQHVSCYHCGKAYKKYMLRRHMIMQHFDVLGVPGPELFACEWCRYTSVSLQSLEKHKSQQHTGETLSCEHCSYTCTTTRSLNVHMGMKHGGSRKSWRPHMQVKFPCATCGKVYASRSTLETHIRRHTGETPYACGMCDYRSPSQSGLSSHVLHKHSDERPYQCSICTYSSKQPHQMKRHMLMHTAEKPYDCKLCGKKFTQAPHVKRHMLVHTGERPYVCEVCGKGWAQKCNLKAHMKVHLKEAGDSSRITFTFPADQSDESDSDPTFMEWVHHDEEV